MTIRSTSTGLLLGLACLWLGLAATTAAAQSANELRQENQRLLAELQDATRELDAAQRRIEQLTAEVEQLRRSLAARGSAPGVPDPPPAPEVVSIDESKPDASPRALLAALTRSYQDTFEDMEIGAPGDRDRLAYTRAVRSWALRANREFKGPIVWHVRHAPTAGVDGGMYFEAVDPASGAPLAGAAPFPVVISRSLGRRLLDRGGLNDVLVLRGVLSPRVNVNLDRESPGVFNNPKLIGPFAEFNFAVEAKSMLSTDEDEKSNRNRTPAREPEKRSR